MTPQTEENINEALNWLQETGSAVQDFAVEQTPFYCQEVVAWAFWEGAFYASAGLLLGIFGLIGFVKFFQWLPESDYESNAKTMPAFIVAIIGSLVGLSLIANHLPDAIKAVVSPRLVIVEHLMNLRK
jgi:hypothetical protein